MDLYLHGDVEFQGIDNDPKSYKDSIKVTAYATSYDNRSFVIRKKLNNPVKLYVEAREGCMIAGGAFPKNPSEKGETSDYKLTKADMDMIQVIDINDPGKHWYKILDKKNNRIYLSPTEEIYSVIYDSNGAEGEIKDERKYKEEETVTVKSHTGLTRDHYTFKGWNTQANGGGKDYPEGKTFEITENLTLYAIYEEDPFITADFYSGEKRTKKTVKGYLEGDAKSATIKAPELEEISGMTKIGWDEGIEGYEGNIKENGDIILTEDTSFYGVYQGIVTLSYDPGTWNITVPEPDTKNCLFKILSYRINCDNEFQIAPAPEEQEGYKFICWTTAPNGGMNYYAESKYIFMKDITLYPSYRLLRDENYTASFYSGNDINNNKEDIKKTVKENIKNVEITTPKIKEMPGWKKIGWENREQTPFQGNIGEDSVITTTQKYTYYYGVYEKDVTVSYVTGDIKNPPQSETKPCRARMEYNKISYQDADFIVAAAPSRPGYRFVEWNTKEDQSGTAYQTGSLKTHEDVTLYAIFESDGKKTFTANFYSGGPKPEEPITETTETEEETESGTVTAPALREFPGWKALGWSKSSEEYEIDNIKNGIKENGECTLTEPVTEYYGIYQKSVTLTYDANGGEEAPNSETKFRYANVHEEITYAEPSFALADAPIRTGYVFQGWSTVPDETENLYDPKSDQKINQDIIFYAIWEKEPDMVNYRVEHYC